MTHKFLNIKSERGFTIADLVSALFIITLFVALISGGMYYIVKVNGETNLTLEASAYLVQILEDIDKISYEEVEADLADTYYQKFSIPVGYEINLEVSKYGEEYNYEDVIKIVKVTISYNFQGNTENISITRLKIKEV